MQLPGVDLKSAQGSFNTRVGGKRLCVHCPLRIAAVVYTLWFPLVETNPPFFSHPPSYTSISCYLVLKRSMETGAGSSAEIFCLALPNTEGTSLCMVRTEVHVLGSTFLQSIGNPVIIPSPPFHSLSHFMVSLRGKDFWIQSQLSWVQISTYLFMRWTSCLLSDSFVLVSASANGDNDNMYSGMFSGGWNNTQACCSLHNLAFLPSFSPFMNSPMSCSTCCLSVHKSILNSCLILLL